MAFPKVKHIEPPSTLPVTLAEVKAHLRVDHADEDALIGTYLGAAISMIDGRDGIFYCLSPQSLEQDSTVCGGRIALPLGPVMSVTSVSGLSAGDYELVAATGTDDAYIRPVNGATWADGAQMVVTYRAGADVVPAALKAVLLLLVGDLYRLREAQSRDDPKENPTVKALLLPYKRDWVS